MQEKRSRRKIHYQWRIDKCTVDGILFQVGLDIHVSPRQCQLDDAGHGHSVNKNLTCESAMLNRSLREKVLFFLFSRLFYSVEESPSPLP